MKLDVNKFSLKWKIFAFMLGFSALLLVILWLLQTVFLNDMYKMIRKREMKKSIEYVEKNIDALDFRTLKDYLEARYDVIMTHSKDFITPLDTGKFTEPPRSQNRDKERRIRMPEALATEKVIMLNSGEQSSFTFYAMITPVNATVTTLRYQLYLITGIMVGLSILLALLIARRISKPIEEINSSAKVLASGDYEIHFAGTGFLEIAELSETLNRAAMELNKVEMLRRELMANISHDLRTPLSLIFSYAEIMHDFPDEISSDQTQVIMDETKRLTSLVNDVFTISKLESGTQQLYLSRFNLTDQLKQTVKRIQELVKKDGYIILFEANGEIDVTADEVKIMQVFYNLLINAINYAGADQHVIVRQIADEHQVRIEVIDHGEGIPEDNFPDIWDRYYKVDQKHKRAITGTGLGLSIVKNVMKLHGGDYGVDSTIGVGSTFWFSLKI